MAKIDFVQDSSIDFQPIDFQVEPTPLNPLDVMGASAQGQARVAQEEAGRESVNIPNAIADWYNQSVQNAQEAGPMGAITGAFTGLPSLLKPVGEAMTRAESVVANPLVNMQRGNFNIPRSVWRGVTGSQKSQYGDFLQQSGLPGISTKTGSQIGGLAMDAAINPGKFAASAGRKLVSEGAGIVSKAVNRKVTPKVFEFTSNILQQQEPRATQFMLDDSMKAMNKSYLPAKKGVQPVARVAGELVDEAEKHLYKPAHDAMEKFAADNIDKPIMGMTSHQIYNQLSELLPTMVEGEAKNNVRFIMNKLGSMESGLFKPNLNLTVGELWGTQRNLSKMAKGNATYIDTINVIADNLKNDYKELEEASNLWKQWKRASGDVNDLVGTPTRESLLKGARENPANLLNIFTDKSGQLETKLDTLQDTLNTASKGTAKNVATEAKRVAAAEDFSKLVPNFKSFSYLGILGAMGAGGWIKAGPLGAAGMGMLGIAAGTPRLTATIAAKMLNEVPKTPGVKNLRSLLMSQGLNAIDEGIVQGVRSTANQQQ